MSGMGRVRSWFCRHLVQCCTASDGGNESILLGFCVAANVGFELILWKTNVLLAQKVTV